MIRRVRVDKSQVETLLLGRQRGGAQVFRVWSKKLTRDVAAVLGDGYVILRATSCGQTGCSRRPASNSPKRLWLRICAESARATRCASVPLQRGFAALKGQPDHRRGLTLRILSETSPHAGRASTSCSQALHRINDRTPRRRQKVDRRACRSTPHA